MSTFTPSGEMLVVLLNETFIPPTIFADTSISFGIPTDAPDGATDYDTVVIGTGIPGRGYYGTAEIHYTRVPLSNLESLVSLNSLDPFTLDVIVSMLNAQYNTFLDDSDLEDVTLPVLNPGDSATVTLTAAPDSLGWKGSVDITINYGKPFIASVVSSRSLAVLSDGLIPGQPLSGIQMLFDIDFTSYRDSLAVTAYEAGTVWAFNGFADYDTLADVFVRIGLPAFPAPTWSFGVADFPTSQIADSNQDFDRVVVMSKVSSGKFAPGPLYFHYNLLDNR